MREIKFRAWDKLDNRMYEVLSIYFETDCLLRSDGMESTFNESILMQFTGLSDKHGVEIYEFMEIDNTLEVQYINGCYVLINISNNDIITLYKYMEQNDGQIEVTKEYTKI